MKENVDKNEEKVSVIIPIYNCEKTIDECIQSIKEQLYENWEIIIVDDGSTDNTYKKVKTWVESDVRIKVFQQENQGAGPARNRGMEVAGGEYIAFLDGDDFWQNRYALKQIMDVIKGHFYDVIGTFYCIYRDGEFIKFPLHRKYFMQGEKSGKWIDFSDEQDSRGFCSYLYRRRFLVENNIEFPSYLTYEDPPFLVKVLEKAERYYVFPIEWSSYRYVYKNVLSTDQKINDFLKGVLDIIEIAHCQHMSALIRSVTDKVKHYSGVIVNSILQGNVEALQLIVELQKYMKNEGTEIAPMQFINHSLKTECQRITDTFIQEINKASKLIIYGAGSGGRRFFEKIIRHNIRIEIVFAQTEKSQNRIVCERNCYSLDELIAYKETALVIIAVRSEKMQDEMISNLGTMGFRKYRVYTDDLLIALECTHAIQK